MAINAYTGLMGSGKSFEVVASVILPAIKKGRRVVTNIVGISIEKIHAYFLQKNPQLDITILGQMVVCSDEQVQASGFFPDEKKPGMVSLVNAGDLVVIDEAWRHWNRDKKLSDAHMQFFRMHRHYTHAETGVCCDLALIFQSICDVHRSVKAVIEMTVRTVKIKTLGLAKTYRVELYEGSKIVKGARFAREVKVYDKAIFPLYQSYAAGDGKELAIDKRQNVLLNPFIWLVVAVLLLVCFFSISFLRKWFGGHQLKKPNSFVVQSSPIVSSSVSAVAVSKIPVLPPVSNLRVSGEVVINGLRWIVLLDEKGHFRLENPALFFGRGVMMVGNVDGQQIATWSGALMPSKDAIKEIQR